MFCAYPRPEKTERQALVFPFFGHCQLLSYRPDIPNLKSDRNNGGYLLPLFYFISHYEIMTFTFCFNGVYEGNVTGIKHN